MGITRSEIAIGARRAALWTGGAGETLLLVHGAWGGAELHWSRVWERLAERFRVVAPELPGVGDDGAGLSSFDAYAGWLAALLQALDVPRAWCIGNSFGAAVAWQLAARLGQRCRGLVLVNGVPPPELPRSVRALATIAPLAPLWRALYRRLNFSPSLLPRAYADPARAPSQLVGVLTHPPRARIDLLLRIVAAGTRAAPRPPVPLLVAWGEADRLPGSAGAEAARRLQRALDARLVLFPAAGHCPQMEQPVQFVEAISSFCAVSSGAECERRAARVS